MSVFSVCISFFVMYQSFLKGRGLGEENLFFKKVFLPQNMILFRQIPFPRIGKDDDDAFALVFGASGEGGGCVECRTA